MSSAAQSTGGLYAAAGRALRGRAGLLLSIVFVLLALALVEPKQVLAQLSSVNPRWLCATLALYSVQVALLGLRWSWIAQLLGIQIGWGRATAECALSTALNQLLPGGALGDGLRALRQSRPKQASFGASLGAVALDRLSGQLGLWLWVLAGLPWTWQLLSAMPQAPTRPGAFSVGAVGVVACAALWVLLTSFLREAQLQRVTRIWQALRALFTVRGLLRHLPLSLLLVALLLLQFDCAARAIGVILPWRALLGLGPLIFVAASLPSLLGGWGLREVASAVLFGAAGVGANTGVAVCVVFGTFLMLVALPGLVVAWTAMRPETKAAQLAPAAATQAPEPFEAPALPDASVLPEVRAASRAVSWGNGHAALMVVVTLFGLWLSTSSVLVCAAGCSFVAFVAQGRATWTPNGRFGAANGVTFVRLLIVLAMPFVAPQAALIAVALSVLALDVLDGWLARKLELSSEFGAAFDVEVDALFVLLLSVSLYQRGLAGLWVTIAGLLRYVYILAPLLVATHEGPAKRSRLGRIGFVLMVLSFVLALALPAAWSYPLSAFGTIVVSASFGLSFWQRYGPKPAPTPE